MVPKAVAVACVVLAALNLERASDRPMRVEILTDRPIFAPQEVQEGLIVGDPITL